jgi:2-polyprenyl-6-hydroxyphenyl methylase/3-demethylubiquinone-9 3-methyltransferase
MASGYYSARLAGERLKLAYDLASPRVRRYLEAEIQHVASRLPAGARVLELGCGYGRVLLPLADRVGVAVGIDTSLASLELARRYLAPARNVVVAAMDATGLGFSPRSFDVVCCVQNGISSFHVDQRSLLAAAVGITRPGGVVLFSSYAASFWPHRLEWFRAQSAAGLIGEIDEGATGDGVIVCTDGFSATTVSPKEFSLLADDLGSKRVIRTVDDSSVFCEIAV